MGDRRRDHSHTSWRNTMQQERDNATGSEKEFIDRVARAVYDGSSELDDVLDGLDDESDDESEGSAEYLMRRCGIGEPGGSPSPMVATCTWVCAEEHLDIDEFDFLEKAVSEERILELENGARLTPEEEYLARKDYCEYAMGGDASFMVTDYYRVEDSQGRPVFFSSTHYDGGMRGYGGPWDRMPDMTGGFDGECLRRWSVNRYRGMRDDSRQSPSLTKGSRVRLPPSLTKRSRVRHPQFGSGTVTELSGFGRDVGAIIDFDTVGQ
jgi:hypothetical protein